MTSEKGVIYYLMKKNNNTISQNVSLELNVNNRCLCIKGDLNMNFP
jgi:hypothetical protein